MVKKNSEETVNEMDSTYSTEMMYSLEIPYKYCSSYTR